MAQVEKKKIKYLIADTTAFINAVPLNEYAENVLTVPDVMMEVRNKRQIRRLCVLPFDLQIREPRVESVRHCVEFAKKTGDYASLSGIDIKVIALTYELEKDTVGTEHLRNEPIMAKIVASRDKPEEFKDTTKLVGWYNPKKGGGGSASEDDDDEEDESDEGGDGEAKESGGEEEKGENEEDLIDRVKEGIEKQLAGGEPSPATNTDTDTAPPPADEVSQEELDKLFEKLKCENPEDDVSCDILVPEQEADSADEEDEEEDESSEEPEQAGSGDEVDDSGWITPANIKKAKKSLEGKVEEDLVPEVACMSTDYALQNVLKQINLNICALNGRVIKHMRTYILRCYGCFKTTSIMTKVFCPNCGNKTLKRVAVSLDENGKQVIHINTRRPLTAKYKNQSIPRFHGGKHSRNPILFEDQPIPRQMPSRVAKTKTNALEEDYVAGFSPFVLRDVDSKSAMLRSKGRLKEWARNNTFEEDRRKKFYNRLYK